MRSRVSRHWECVFMEPPPGAPAAVSAAVPRLAAAAAAPATPIPPPEFNWRGHAAFLLHVAAEIEHSLMVQYLFAAYSLGGDQVPQGLQASVRLWQETI